MTNKALIYVALTASGTISVGIAFFYAFLALRRPSLFLDIATGPRPTHVLHTILKPLAVAGAWTVGVGHSYLLLHFLPPDARVGVSCAYALAFTIAVIAYTVAIAYGRVQAEWESAHLKACRRQIRSLGHEPARPNSTTPHHAEAPSD